MDDPIYIAIMVGALLVSVIIHEMAHAWSAYKMGDPTGKMDNRLSFNPVYHIDPFMTILLPILTIASLGFAFGGAKPVRINPLNFRNPGRGMMISAACGPLSNFLLGFLAFGVALLLVKIAPNMIFGKEGSKLIFTYNGHFFWFFIWINLILGAFNLIPIPPLDGSRIMRYFLPDEGKRFMDRIEPFGLFIIVGLIYVGGTRMVLGPLYRFVDYIFNVLASLATF